MFERSFPTFSLISAYRLGLLPITSAVLGNGELSSVMVNSPFIVGDNLTQKCNFFCKPSFKSLADQQMSQFLIAVKGKRSAGIILLAAV